MICAEFFREKGNLIGFSIRGHANYSRDGDDIVCASVSSAVQFASNLITECFLIKANVNVVGESVNLLLTQRDNRDSAVKVLDALSMHLNLLSNDYKDTIKITFSEV